MKKIKAQPKEIRIVKLADRITNLQPPPSNWKKDKIGKYRDDSKVILDMLWDASTYLAERLKNKITNYETYITK